MSVFLKRIDAPPVRGERLRVLAELEMISMSALAQSLGISQSAMSKIVSGERCLEPALTQRACDLYDLPSSFFRVDDPLGAYGAVTFRKKSDTSATCDKYVTRLFDEARRVWSQVSGETGYKRFVFADDSLEGLSPDELALRVRECLGIKETAPVNNVTRALERLGVGVIDALADNDLRGGDYSGLSKPTRYNDRPLVACIRPLPGAVQRLTLAHELAHLIYDHDLPAPPRSRSVEEKRAFAFAGAFLLPEVMMRAQVSESLTLNGFLPIKARYGVSVGAIIQRARSLDLISESRQKSLHIQLHSRGWRTHEPVSVPQERSALIAQALHRLWGENLRTLSDKTGVGYRHIARWINVPITDDPLASVIDFSSRVRTSAHS